MRTKKRRWKNLTAQEKDEYNKRKISYKQNFSKYKLDQMSDEQVIEFVLMLSLTGADAKVVAKNLFDRFASYVAILEASVEELLEVEGMNEQSACLINMIMPLYSVYHNSLEDKMKNKFKLETSKTIFEYLQPKFIDTSNERIIVVFLRDDNTLVESRIIGEGAFNGVELNKSKVIITALKLNCKNVILAHNHPHGKNKPSAQDDMMTRDLISALIPMGINLVEHIIVSDNHYYSYKENHNIIK